MRASLRSLAGWRGSRRRLSMAAPGIAFLPIRTAARVSPNVRETGLSRRDSVNRTRRGETRLSRVTLSAARSRRSIACRNVLYGPGRAFGRGLFGRLGLDVRLRRGQLFVVDIPNVAARQD